MARRCKKTRVPIDFLDPVNDLTLDLNKELEAKGQKKRLSHNDTMLLLGDKIKSDFKFKNDLLTGLNTRRMKYGRRKRGNVQDTGFMLVMLFIAAVVGVLMLFIMDSVNTEIQAQPESVIPNVSKDIMDWNNNKFVALFDSAIPLMLVGGIGGISALATVISGSPGFALIGLTIVTMYLFIAAVFSNMYFEIVGANAGLAAMSSNLTMTEFILTNFPLVILMLALIVIMVFYSKYNRT